MLSADPYLTVIDEVAASKDLTIKATVKAELDITVTTWDTLIDTLIHQVSAKFVSHCGREFAREKVTDHFRIPAGRDTETLQLSRFPVTTVHSIVEDDVALTAGDYEVNIRSGFVWRLDGAGGRICWTSGVKTTVQHTSGYLLLASLPHDIEKACLDQVKATYQSRKRDATIRSRTIPDVYQASYSAAGGDDFGDSGLLRTVEDALAAHCRPVCP